MSDDFIEASSVIDATRAQVFNACSQPELVARWRKPANCEITVSDSDFRVGGKWRQCMRTPDGNEMWSGGEFESIVTDELIVSLDYMTDAAGGRLDPGAMGMDWPATTRLRVTLADEDGQTRITLRHELIPPSPMRDNVASAWQQALDSLAQLLAEDPA